MSFLTIPPELYFPIFSFLDIEDLSRLVQTSKYFHRIGSHYLRRRIDHQTLRVISEFQEVEVPRTSPIERAPFIQDDYFEYRLGFGFDFTAVDNDTNAATQESTNDINTLADLVKNRIKSSGPSIKDGALYASKHGT